MTKKERTFNSIYTDYIKGLHYVGEATIGRFSTEGHTLSINLYKTDFIHGGIYLDNELIIEGQYKDLVEFFLDSTTRSHNRVDWDFWTNKGAVKYVWEVTPKFVYSNYKAQHESSSKTEFDFAKEAQWHLGVFQEYQAVLDSILCDGKYNDRH